MQKKPCTSHKTSLDKVFLQKFGIKILDFFNNHVIVKQAIISKEKL